MTTLTITPPGANATPYLLAQPSRSRDGTPAGPDNLEYRAQKGVLDREPVGAQGIDTEAVGCDRRTLTFSATRTYATPAAALEAFATVETECPDLGAVKLGAATLIGKATLRSISARMTGVTITVVYAFEGY